MKVQKQRKCSISQKMRKIRILTASCYILSALPIRCCDTEKTINLTSSSILPLFSVEKSALSIYMLLFLMLRKRTSLCTLEFWKNQIYTMIVRRTSL